MAQVVFDHVMKEFGDYRAVNDLNVEVPDGEFLVFVGPSGCGKTTTLRLLAGLEEIDGGTIKVGERVVNDVPPGERDIAMVFQSYALYPHMSVYDNMAFSLKLKKVPRAEIDRRVRQAAADLSLEKLLDRKPRALSGGQRQRVAVGRAIVREPQVFLMDEPLSNLDAKLRVEARALLSKLHERLNTTFVYVTHDQVEAMTLGTRIAVMNLGELQQVAPPDVLYKQPANAFVGGFIGNPGMNFFPVRVIERDGQRLLETRFSAIEPPQVLREAAQQVEVGKPLLLGIRPEDIYDPAEAPGHIVPLEINGEVTLVEQTGSEMYVHMLTEGATAFIARFTPRSRAKTGDVIPTVFNANRLYLFDAESGAALY